MHITTPDRPVMSVPEVAKALGIAESTTWRGLASGRIPLKTFKVAGSTRIRTSDFHSFIERAA